MAESARGTGSALVLELAREFLDRCRGGERPPLKEYTDRFPEHATEIREVFRALAVLDNLGPVDTFDDTGPANGAAAVYLPGIAQLGDFRILRELGRGGMGVVYEAEQLSLGRRVALKVLPAHVAGDSKVLERFRREAKAAARLHHTNIVPVFEVGRDGDIAFFAMQFIQGQGLDRVIEELAAHYGVDWKAVTDRPAVDEDDGPLGSESTTLAEGGSVADSRRRPLGRVAESLLNGRLQSEGLVAPSADSSALAGPVGTGSFDPARLPPARMP